jgi:histidinol-phosphatase
VNGRNVLGVVAAPALDEVYDAADGLGARMNGEAIQVDARTELEEALVLTSGAKRFSEHGMAGFYAKLTHRAWRSRGFADFWGHMLVARGAAHVMVEPMLSTWDVAALEPIVREAGGTLSNMSGAPWTADEGVITTNGELHDEVVALATGSSG